jgi:ABC-2 type transport system ATP-binding protein
MPITVEKLAIHTPDLDDVFFALTGHESAQESDVTPENATARK